jgi:quercetin dioxygenase-like cupin family protein
MKMIIAHESAAPSMDVPEPHRRTLKVLLSPLLHRDLDRLAAGLTIIPPGGSSDPHAHEEGEMFYVLAGMCSITIGKEKRELNTGTAVWGPPGISHQLFNDSDSPCKILWVLCPPGREKNIIDNAR